MKAKTQKKIILALKIITALFVVLSFVFYQFRDAVLQQTIAKVANEMEVEYNSSFTVKKASFDGISGLQLTDVILAPKNADTLFKIKKLKTNINLIQLLVGDVQLGSLDIKNGSIQLVKKGNIRNFDAFIRKDKNTEITTEKRDYAKITYRIISKILNLVPNNMALENLKFSIDDNGKKALIYIPKLVLDDNQLESDIDVKTNTFSQHWKIKGSAYPRDKKADIRFFNRDKGPIKVPYFDERYNLQSTFESVRLKIDNIDKDGDELHIDGSTAIKNLLVNHAKIANKPVVIKNVRFDFNFLLGTDFISIDSASTIQVNKVKLRTYAVYDTKKDTTYKLRINIPKMKAQDFISSLPDGLFTHFQGMQAKGKFDYHLNFAYNKNKPNQLVFDSNINRERLIITRYGEANLSKLNGEFIYRALINNVFQRPIIVGAANQDYTPLDQISPYLRKSVLTTEDPSFFSHHGFINEAFKQSIIKNIKTHKFSRGASTISMQLVKNVFLTREKTLSRKLEEILLVYVLENNRIVSKERMLEVYFNIIEWGPNIYGIGEASKFYFQKTPAELNLNECLYLARIIPSPKKFMYQFNDQGTLKNYAIKQESYLTDIMFKRGLLIPDDTLYKMHGVFISGPARSYLSIKRQDSTQVQIDSTAVEGEFDL